MSNIMLNAGSSSIEDSQQNNVERALELLDAALDVSTTASVRTLQERLQATSSQYSSSLSGISRRISLAPYRTPQEHMAQKRPPYTPHLHNSGPCVQQFQGVVPQRFSSAQSASGSANQFPNQSSSSSARQPSITNSNNLMQPAMQPIPFPQTNNYLNQLYPHHQINHFLNQTSAHNQQYGQQQYPARNNFQFNQLSRRCPSLTANVMSVNPTHSLSSATSVVPNVSQNLDLNPIYPELRPPILSHYSSVFGNSTHTLTPAFGATPYISPNHIYPERRLSFLTQNTNNLRVSFPIQGGTVLPPFGLEHPPNMPVSTKPFVSTQFFQLKASVYQMLMSRSDLELQLKCFHKEDGQLNTKWPICVRVSVNGTALDVDRLNIETPNRPLYLKQFCQLGRNTIRIIATACPCSYLFSLQLVQQATVSSLVQTLLRKRLLFSRNCVEKIKRIFPSVAASQSNTLNSNEESASVRISLKCPISFKRIFLPARGQECNHIQCFDLESYIESNSKTDVWKCPVCNKPAFVKGLEVDQFIWNIVTNLMNSGIDEIVIDSSANWKPVHIKSSQGIKCPMCSNVMPSDDVECHLVMCLTKPGVNHNEIKCPGCSKLIPPEEDVKCHLVMCLTKPRITYNEDTLTEDNGECVICFEDLTKGSLIARLSCLCIYHKTCIDSWFKLNRSCPAHPIDKDSTSN